MEIGTSVNRLSVNVSPCAASWIETLFPNDNKSSPECGVYGGGSDFRCFGFP